MNGAAPAISRRPVTDTDHALVVADPDRWPEDSRLPALPAWEGARSRRTRAPLDGLGSRGDLGRRGAKPAPHSSPFPHALTPEQPNVAVMPPSGDPRAGRVVVDPNTRGPAGQTATDRDVPSPDGKPVAVSLSRAGTGFGRVRDGERPPAISVRTGTHHGRIDPAQARKMIARLLHATVSGLPAYLALGDKTGHGIGRSFCARTDRKTNQMARPTDQPRMWPPAAGAATR